MACSKPRSARPSATPDARTIHPNTRVSAPPMMEGLPAWLVDFVASGMRGAPHDVQYASTPRYTIGALERQLGHVAGGIRELERAHGFVCVKRDTLSLCGRKHGSSSGATMMASRRK
jgi:hypothetical protein